MIGYLVCNLLAESFEKKFKMATSILPQLGFGKMYFLKRGIGVGMNEQYVWDNLDQVLFIRKTLIHLLI